MATVVGRIREVTQPRGGFVSPRSMAAMVHQDHHPELLALSDENVSPSIVGLAVDYLTRLKSGTEPTEAFKISLKGAHNISLMGAHNHWPTILEQAWEDVASLRSGVVDEAAILAACRLSSFDVGYRAGPGHYNPNANATPNATTIERIGLMVSRTTSLLEIYGPITKDGFDFPGAYTELVGAGDGDFLTRDTLWDLKVSVRPPTSNHTLQILMYWLMGIKSGQPEFETIQYLGIFNARSNISYRAEISRIPDSTLTTVSREVIGYPSAP